MKTYIGIDPGKNGGIAFVADRGDPWTANLKDCTNKDLCDLIREIEDIEVFAVLEFVRSSPQMGVVSAFSFGRNFGALEMLLISCGIPHETVTPAKWQKAMGCLTKGDKNVSKAKAQELFPSLKITHSNADALLIAEYARRNF